MSAARRAAPTEVRSVTVDLDGTLLDTVPDLAAAASAMLAELGLPQRSVAEIRSFVGRGMDYLVRCCLGDQAHLHETAVAVFKGHYRANNGRAARLYPGVISGLAAFRAAGLPLAVVTNKPAAFTLPLLAASKLAPYFDFVLCGDTLPEKKPHPLPLLHACERFGVLPAANLHIGDSENDAGAARAAGCPVFCLPYGYNHGKDVRLIECDAIVASLKEASARVIEA